MKPLSVLALSCLAVLATVSTASADAVDGDWCYKDGRNFNINGPKIITPGGQHHTGEYDRHGFEYVVPPGEQNAGKRVFMAQQSEELLYVWVGTDGQPRPQVEPEMWGRCKMNTS